MRSPVYLFIAATIGWGWIPALFAQTATTAVISGTVKDPSGAVVPGASVELVELNTKLSRQQTTNEAGQYFFPSVPPGQYDLKVSAAGFRSATVHALRVEVARSYVQDVELEVGAITETVAVTAEARAELQTVDATVGNVLSGRSLPVLPTFTRQANELLTLQPGVTPDGQVTGARNDQSTFSLDGIEVTNQSVGGLTTYMYLGIESVEEFRVAVANPNASFGRGAGGQVAIIGRRGSNDLHGALYWYHQNDDLNANTWTNNRNKIKEPELKDNRFGFRAGGPVLRDRIFYFVNYDGRRFPRSSDINRLVPTESLRRGELRFRDAAGNINTYPLATARLCGPTGDQPCDPRGLGLSPAIAKLWSFLPPGNDPSLGDGLNTIGFRATVQHPFTSDFYMGRLDFNLNSNWRLDGAFRYYRELDRSNAQLSIINGNVQSVRQFPNRQNMVNVGLTGAFRPNLTAEFRFGWVRVRPATDSLRPNEAAKILGIPETNTPEGYVALDQGALEGTYALLAEPIDVGTQVARKQANDNRIFQWNADMNWVRGRHSFQFGSHVRFLPTRHLRDDKVLGALGALVAQIDSDYGAIRLPASVAPPTCGPGRTTYCLQASDVRQWNRLYASALGIIDNVSIMVVRDGDFKPLPYGTLLESDTRGIRAPEFYFQDVWRLSSSLTVTLGLSYGWQTPPTERLGRYTFQILRDTGEFVTAENFLNARRRAAEQGQIYNPEFAFLPIKAAGGKRVFDVDWNNISPRLSASWNPSVTRGWLGRLLGDRKTVFRGGWSLIYDRQNTVQSVIIPSLGVAFAQTINVSAPPCNASGQGGRGCDPTNPNQAASVFRVGQDGTIPLPKVPEQSIPVSPPWCKTGSANCLFPEILSFQVDPTMKVGENHAVDFTIQRELPADMLLEVGFAGRYARKLPQSMNLGQVPYMHRDPASGQTFAQAFDAVATALRAGLTPTPQPWFENQVPGGTAALVSAARSNFINGDLNALFLTLDLRRMAQGLPPFNNYMSRTLFLRSSLGRSNYNALLVTLRKRMSHGLTYDLNYTFSRSLDQVGYWQNSANVMPNNFDLNAEYGPSVYDFTHMFVGHWLYDLPFRTGRRGLDRLVGGWQLSGIFTARSGDPLTVTQGSQVWGGSLFLGFSSGAIPTRNPKEFGNTVHRNVAGTGGVGTTGDPATGGSGLNLFADPESVFKSFRRVLISQDGRSGRANPLRGLPRWNLDVSVGKRIQVVERVSARISFDFFNVFNKVDFVNPTLDLNNPRAFGVLSTQFTPPNRFAGSRWIQAGFRVEF